jgi:hypothetical protein
MYFKNYNPTLHDVYVYGDGNTGYPTGLNTNCLIYDARKSYQAISLRERSWTITGPSGGPPEGATVGVYPNYYNIGYPLFWWVSKTMLGACTHFSSDIPCDSIAGEQSFVVKETGLTGSYDRYYWDSDLSNKTFYSNFRGIYNASEYQPYVDVPRYFKGWSGTSLACEEQAPGFGTGSTFYQITTTDYSFSRLPSTSSPNQYNGKVLKSISPLSILTQEQVKGITSYLISTNDTNPFELGNIVYEFPVSDVYFWGGNDTIQPVAKIRLGYRQVGFITGSLWDNTSIKYKRGPFIRLLFDEEEESILWTGDSSGLLLYKKNNELFSISSLLTTAGRGDLHASSLLPPVEYLRQETDIDAYSYFYSNRGVGTAAGTSGFSGLQLQMAIALSNAQKQATLLSTIPNIPTGLTLVGVTYYGITLNWTDTSDNESGFRIYYKKYVPYPTPPSGLTYLEKNETEILLSFTDNSVNEDGFKIYSVRDLY